MSQQRNRRCKKEQMEILEMKNKTTKIKSSVNGLNGKMEGTEERINELEHRTTEITKSEKLKENGWGRKIVLSPKANVHVIRVLREEQEKSKTENVLKEKMAE